MDWTFIFQQSISSAVGVNAIIFALAAIGLNMHFGYTGLLNFGQAGFLAVGAYTVAVLVVNFDVSVWIAFLAGIFAAILLALLLGVPTLRLRADYLAIVTIATAEIIRQVARSVTLREYFGGSDGITGKFGADFFAINPFPAGLDLPLLRYTPNDLWVVVVGWGLVVIFVFFTYLMMRSPWGRVIKAIREDEEAVRSLGKNVYLYKMQSLVLGGVVGAFAGFVYAISRQSVQPDNYSTALTFFAYAVLILGGAARVLGPVVGAVIFWFLLVFIEQTLRGLVNIDKIPDWLMNQNQVGQVRFMLVGLGLMLLMIYRPQGIFGDKKELALDARA
ncbi:MAG: inner-membrane translocator [actinobacterium acAMD-5]|jgi:branched-chain amino acid transport system permease protein|nr:MAG: inner-membrane translocator [actinobacterium acAMD-5]